MFRLVCPNFGKEETQILPVADPFCVYPHTGRLRVGIQSGNIGGTDLDYYLIYDRNAGMPILLLWLLGA